MFANNTVMVRGRVETLARKSAKVAIVLGTVLGALAQVPTMALDAKGVVVDGNAPAIAGAPTLTGGVKLSLLDPAASGSMDLSPIGMFEGAGGVVQAVIIGLLIASVATWTISLAKWFQLRGEQRRLRAATQTLRMAQDFSGIGKIEYAPLADMILHAEDEMVASGQAGPNMSADGVKDRIALRLEQIEADLRLNAGRGIGILAIVSSTAPFVGLAGTVWGIMNSFIGIAHSHTTSLAVVAPGIAEALLTTAIGLVAAIPAGVLYNVFARLLATYAGSLASAGATVQCLAAREVDATRQQDDAAVTGRS